MSSRPSAVPAPLPEDRLASVFETRVGPAWWGPFAKKLAGAVAGRVRPASRVLELGCATGLLSVELAALVPEGRVMAIEPRRALLDAARRRAGPLSGKRIFFKQEPLDRSGFADGTFDAVVSNLPFEVADRDAVLGEMRRVAAPGATVALTAAVAGTWAVVLDLYGEVLERFQFTGAVERLARVRARYPAVDGLGARLEEFGLRDVSVQPFSFSLRFRNARDLFRDDLVAAGPVAAWKEVAGEDRSWERAVFHLREAMDTYFAGADAIDVPVQGAVATAVAG